MKRFFSVTPHLKHIYGFYLKHGKVRKDTVLIESFHGKTIGDSSLVLAEELLRSSGGKYRIFFATSSHEKHAEFLKGNGIKAELVTIDTAKYVRLLATAGYLISNASLPTYFIRRDEQVYLQTWHGTPLKTLGKSMRYGIESMYNVQHNFLQASYILQPNEFTRDVIMKDYFLDDLYTGKVVMCGYPRNRILIRNTETDRLRAELGLSDKKVYAYMPTWRGKSSSAVEISDYFSAVKDIFDVLEACLPEDSVMYVNFHPIVQGAFDFGGYSKIKPFPAGVDTYEFLSVTDALITDYSSVFFDYSLTGKPIVLFMYDYEEYMRDRDLYMDVKTLPFRKVFSTSELAELLKDGSIPAGPEDSQEKMSAYREKFLKYDSYDGPGKLVKLITEGDESDLEIIDYSSNKERKWDVYRPSGAPNESYLDELSKLTEKKSETLVLLYRKWFRDGSLNELLHKYGNVKYVITNNNVPASYALLILRKLGIGAASREFHDLDMRRKIPGLDAEHEMGRGCGSRNDGQIRSADMITQDGYLRGASGGYAELRKVRISGRTISMTVLLSGWSRKDVDSAVLKYVSKVEDLSIPMATSITETEKGLLISASLELGSDLPLKPVGWNACIAIRYGQKLYYIKVRTWSRKLKRDLKLFSPEAGFADDMILFPFFSKWGTLKFCCRKRSEYDSALVKTKEIMALIACKAAGKKLRRRKLILISEKFSKSAQDNSYYFFRYLMENLPEKERSRIYYVIDKRSSDYEKIKKYDKNVIQFMSLKHMIYGMTARVLASTDQVTHFYAWQTKPSPVFDRIRNVPELFLQHGVTALKKIDRLFGAHSSNPMKYFVATSDIEKDIIVKNCGYPEEDVPVTGFTRWDVLEDKKTDEDRFVLIMPTWRAWLEGADDDEFRNSEYYQRYKELLSSERLHRILKDNCLKAVLYLHPIFAGYIDEFSPQADDTIRCVPFGAEPLNDIMMRAEMLITDYSSVCWDMLYMDKPVIFYQFDREKYLTQHGAYIDLEKDLPGDSTDDMETVLGSIEEHIANGFRIKDEYQEQADRFFKYKDNNNCKRTYDFLIGKIGKGRD